MSIVLWLIPGDSVWWGVGLLILGLIVLYIRRDDVTEAFSVLTGPEAFARYSDSQYCFS
ncbi:hypothetical protein [Halosimplex amylolyticum]|uniref:hypothetical protein n=1 Tax=Halosimplex amylolyticum TaxID=3396616 RepID=UPI003F5722B6